MILCIIFRVFSNCLLFLYNKLLEIKLSKRKTSRDNLPVCLFSHWDWICSIPFPSTLGSYVFQEYTKQKINTTCKILQFDSKCRGKMYVLSVNSTIKHLKFQEQVTWSTGQNISSTFFHSWTWFLSSCIASFPLFARSNVVKSPAFFLSDPTT